MARTDPAKSDASLAALIPLGSHAAAPAIDLKRPITLIGSRKETVRLHLQSSTVSKAHCAIVLNGWGCYVHDLASRTGTLVNGRPVTDANLSDGDQLQIGRFQFRYRAPANAKSRQFPAAPVELTVSTLDGPLLIDKRVIVIGRRVGSDVRFDDGRVSNLHAVIFETDGRRVVRDLGSRTGTWLGGQPVHQEVLPLGVEVKIGAAALALRLRPATDINDLSAAGAPLTLAEAPAPAPPATFDAPAEAARVVVPDLDLPEPDAPDLEPLELDLEPPAAAPPVAGDDLAALRRGWKAPRPAGPTLPPAPVAETPAPPAKMPVEAEDVAETAAPAAELETPAPEPLDLESPEGVAPAADAEALAVEPLRPDPDAPLGDAVPEDTAPLVAEAPAPPRKRKSRAKGKKTSKASPPEPSVVVPLADVDVSAPPAAETPPAAADIEAAPLPIDAEADAIAPVAESTPSEAAAVASDEAATPEASDVAAPLAELPPPDLALEPLEPAVIAPVEEAEVVVPAAEGLVADPDTPFEDAADAPLAAAAEEESLRALEPAEVNEIELLTQDDAAATIPNEAEAAADAVPETPAIAAPPLDVVPAATDADLLSLDGAEVEAELPVEAAADALVEPAIESAAPAVQLTPPAAEADVDDDLADFEPLDLDALDAPSEAATAEAPAADVRDEGPSTSFAGDAAAVPAARPPAGAMPAVVSEAAETPVPSLTDDATRGSGGRFVPHHELVEPDLVRLDEDDADDDAEATAMAVDLGLVLDEDAIDPHDVEPHEAAPPSSPVEIDLAAAHPVAPAADATPDHTPPAEVFEADVVAHEDDPFGPPVADAHEPEIPAPSGGNLSDLMGGGPPLLGGSFLSFPPLPPHVDEPDFGQSRPAAEIPHSSPFGGGNGHAGHGQGGNGTGGHGTGGNGTGGGNGLAEKRRPLRVGFGSGAARSNRPAPFASERTIADAFGANDAGDTFAAPSPAAEFPETPVTPITEDTPPDDGPLPEPVSVAAAPELLAPPERQRPRGVIQPVLATASLAVPAADPEQLSQRARLHRRRIRRVILCLLAMLVLIGGAVYGIYAYTPLRSSLDALITYEGLDRLGIEDATLFRRRQNDLLVDEAVRQKAVAMLPAGLSQPKDFGFLFNRERVFHAIDTDPQTRWPADQPSVMRLRVRSDDKENDLARLRVLAQALVDASDPDRRQADALRNQNAIDMNDVRQRRRQLGDLDDELQALKQAAENRPDPAKLAALRAEYTAAEPTLTDATMRRQELDATVERLKRPIGVPATSPAADPLQADAALQDLNQQLAAVQQVPTTAPSAAPARQQLDDAIARFQTDLAFAQKMRDTPELAAYVDAANGMFTKTRDVTDNLLHSQELQQTQLTELKGHLSDMMQGGIQDRLDKDIELKKLNDRLAIDIREHNAAEASGFEDEAKKGELELALVRAKISERQDFLSHDPVSSAAITALQGMIEQSETRIRTDRKQVDEMLSAEQDKFVKNTPAVEKLPAEQKLLAETLERKLAAVTDARHAYDVAADQAQTEQAAAEADAQARTTALRLQIAARRNDILAAAKARQAQDDETTRQKKLEAAQAQLAAVRQEEQAAQHRVADAAAAIETAEKMRRASVQSDAERETKLAARADIERDLKAVQSAMDTHAAQLAKLIVPDPKIESHDYDDADRRPLFAGLAASVIFLTLLVPVVANLLALAREVHPPATPTRPAAPPEGFEPVMLPPHEHKALPAPASM